MRALFKMKKETIGYLQIIIASALFGFIPVLIVFAEGMSLVNLSFFRIVVSIMCIGLLFLFFKNFELKKIRKEKLKLILFGAVHGFIILGYFIAIRYLNITSAVLLVYSAPIWMILFSIFILKEEIKIKGILALLVAVIGLLFIIGIRDLSIKGEIIGVLSGLLAGIGFGLVYVLSKTFKSYDKVSLTFWQNVIALPFLLPLLLIYPPSAIDFTLKAVLIIILLGSVFTALPFILVFKGFAKVKAHKGAVIVLLDIIFPILFAFLIFFEIPTFNEIIGGVLIILGSYLAIKG